MHFTDILPLATVALAAPWGHGGASGPHWGRGSQGSCDSVAYWLNNDPNGSFVAAAPIASNGSLLFPTSKTSTGGYGNIALNESLLQQPDDSLGGQGAITISGNMIFTVNAGSNTAVMLSIDPKDPENPKVVGEPVSTQGEFPMSITYSPQLNKACVVNAGAVAGVTCYDVDAEKGLTIDAPLRPLSKTYYNETTPPVGPPGTTGQILFDPAGTAVFVSSKANTTYTKGSVFVWPVSDGAISTDAPIVNQIDGIVDNFGFSFLNETTIIMSDPSFGAALMEVQSDFSIIETVHTVISEEKTTCWTEFDLDLKTIYILDGSVDTIFLLDSDTGARSGNIPVTLPGPNTTVNSGVFDAKVSNGRMYALVASNGLLVVDLAEQKQVQYLDLSTWGTRQYYQGMAIWP